VSNAPYALTPDEIPRLEDLELELVDGSTDERICMVVASARTGELAWAGWQSIDGTFDTSVSEHAVRRGGYGDLRPLAEILESEPPSIYMADGSTAYGRITFQPMRTQTFLPEIDFAQWDWTGVDMTTESKKSDRSDTVHDEIERRLGAIRTDGVMRWVLCNDGRGEIADHIVIERDSIGRYRLELWHAKAASSPTPSVRVKDMQVVAVQALKSRGHFTDREFWRRLGRRLSGLETPKATFVTGDQDELKALCGLDPEWRGIRLDQRPPLLTGKIVVVQPGLSISTLRTAAERESKVLAVGQVREFLVALHNATAGSQTVEIVGSV
jgi:hypothetical protein